MKIRRFREEDARKVSYLIRKCLREVNSKDYPEETIQFLSDNYSPKKLIETSKKRKIYVAVDGDTILGTAGIDENVILGVFVNPKFHGRGIGRKLMARAEEHAKSNGYKQVILPSSLTAVDSYRKIGYRKIREKFDQNAGKVIIMKKAM
jgi:GNAT superfamily N-acetyltransferase